VCSPSDRHGFWGECPGWLWKIPRFRRRSRPTRGPVRVAGEQDDTVDLVIKPFYTKNLWRATAKLHLETLVYPPQKYVTVRRFFLDVVGKANNNGSNFPLPYAISLTCLQ
jgi:hypothetical protein